MTNYTIGETITVEASTNAGAGETISEYLWMWNETEYEGNTNIVNIDTIGYLPGEYILSLEVLNSCGKWSSPYSELITLVIDGEEPPEEEPEEDDMSKMYAIVGGIGLGLLFMFKNK